MRLEILYTFQLAYVGEYVGEWGMDVVGRYLLRNRSGCSDQLSHACQSQEKILQRAPKNTHHHGHKFQLT